MASHCTIKVYRWGLHLFGDTFALLLVDLLSVFGDFDPWTWLLSESVTEISIFSEFLLLMAIAKSTVFSKIVLFGFLRLYQINSLNNISESYTKCSSHYLCPSRLLRFPFIHGQGNQMCLNLRLVDDHLLRGIPSWVQNSYSRYNVSGRHNRNEL